MRRSRLCVQACAAVRKRKFFRGADPSGSGSPFCGKNQEQRGRGNNGMEVQDENKAMALRLRYVACAGGAALLSCMGFGSAVRVPEEADGLPVRALCPYAFSSPQSAAAHLPAGTKVRTVETEGDSAPGSEETFLGGSSLREAVLPTGIREIGEYSFYNCTSLSRVVFGAGEVRVGNGAFMNCGALRELVFDADPGGKTCLSGLLAEIQGEVRAVFRPEGRTEAVWIFPEYFEESIENAPARIFEHFIRGAGYRYRQCFRGDRLDAEEYDGQFAAAGAEMEPRTALRIALERLRRPYRLSAAAKARYLGWLREHTSDAAVFFVDMDDPAGLSFLAERGVLTRESVERALKAAAEAGRAECLSVLLSEKHRRFAPKEKEYDL